MTDSTQKAYAEAEARYTAANPASRAAHEAATSLPGGNTRSVLYWEPYPLCIDSAEGYALHDVDGHSYVDLLGEYSAGLYGHSHPTLLAAITETARRGLSYGGFQYACYLPPYLLYLNFLSSYPFSSLCFLLDFLDRLLV